MKAGVLLLVTQMGALLLVSCSEQNLSAKSPVLQPVPVLNKMRLPVFVNLTAGFVVAAQCPCILSNTFSIRVVHQHDDQLIQ